MNISHYVNPIRQPNLNDCWATCLAMVLSLRGLEGVEEIKRRAAGIHLNRSGSIPPGSVPLLAQRLHFRLANLKTPPQLLNTSLLTTVLRRSCAAGFGNYNYPGRPTSRMHVLLFYGLTGNDSNPMVQMVDPYTARRINYYMDEINESLGSVDYFLYQ